MKTPSDLFNREPTTPHELFTQLCVTKNIERRKHLNSIWQWYFANRLSDKNFQSDFPINTSQRWWELEVAWFLKNIGVSLSVKNSAGSDFSCKLDDVKFEVEAVVAGKGSDKNPDCVNELIPLGAAIHKFTEHIQLEERERMELLRLTSSIETKARKHICDINKGYSDPSCPFIIAISPTDIKPLVSNIGIPAAVKAVYSIGEQYYAIEPSTGKFIEHGWNYRPLLHKTSTAKPISSAYFLPTTKIFRYRNISALLFSTLDIWECGYPYTPYDHMKRFILVHNANCLNPLQRQSIKAGTEYWIEPTEHDDFLLKMQNNGDQKI